MTISTEKPAIYDRLEAAFGKGLWDQGVVITYGDTVHCKSGGMSLDLREHEATHIRQQAAYGRDAWWDRYLIDKDFRFSQELEAYQVQARYIRANIHNRKKQERALDWICTCMAEMYGGMVSYDEAKKLI